MSASITSENKGPRLKDQNLGFLTVGRRNIFNSNTYLSDISKFEQCNKAHSSPQSLGYDYKKIAVPKQWNQPTGLVSQILQEKRDILIGNLKQKVKLLAEESVTRNFIHEQSSNVTAFCVSVDDCLRFGLILKKLALFNREPPTFTLLRELAKSLPEARNVVRKVHELSEKKNANTLNQSSPSYVDSIRRGVPDVMPKCLWIRIALFQKSLNNIIDYLVENAASYYERVSIIAHPFDGPLFADLIRGPCTHDYTRIRTSDHLWTDPSAGELIQRKRIYTAGVQGSRRQQGAAATVEKRVRPHPWVRPRPLLDSGVEILTDYLQPPPTDFFFHFEPDHISPASLIYQAYSPSATVRDNVERTITDAISTEKHTAENFTPDRSLTDNKHHGCHQHHQPGSIFSLQPTVQKLTQAMDYVESLHQNERAPLFYGKNNVLVQPNMSSTQISGYLSIHKAGLLGDDAGLQLKWAPNRAMSTPQEANEHHPKNQLLYGSPLSTITVEDASKHALHESSYWDFVLDININEVVYIHCHRHHFDSAGGTVILVRADGVQCPPLTFPVFSQVISFMQCLETHLAPNGSLIPQTRDVDWGENSDSAQRSPSPPSSSSSLEAHNEIPSSPSAVSSTQFCFRIDTVEASLVRKQESAFRLFASTLRGSRPVKTLSTDNLSDAGKSSPPTANSSQVAVNAMTSFSNTYHSMQHQILVRVFSGWLAYTRSVNQIRNRLQNLVYPRCLMPEPPPLDAEPLNAEFWHNFRHLGAKNIHIRDVYKHIYFGGCDPALRREVWPFLLGHYPWSATAGEIEEIDRRTRMAYERSVSEWLSAEVIILQQRHGHRGPLPAIPAAVDAPVAVADRRASFARSRSSSLRRGSATSDKYSVLSDAWNRVKRRLSSVAAFSSKRTDVVQEGSNASLNVTNSVSSSNGLPPLPPKYSNESEAINVVSRDEVTSDCLNSVDVIDDRTEDCTLTTTDDDDAMEIAITANQTRRLAIARAQSCPNSPQSGQNHHKVPMHVAVSSSIDQANDFDVDDVFQPRVLPLDRSPELPTQCSRERKRSRYLRDEMSGASYSSEVLEALSVNIQRIDKDVARCDRNYYYFSKGLPGGDNSYQTMASEQAMGGLCVASLDLSANLYRLRTIMCTWIWQHMETGYIQGMCDLLAPLLVVLEDEALTYACFHQLMGMMLTNFPLVSGTTVMTPGTAAAAGIVLPHLLESVAFKRAPDRHYQFTRPKTKQQILHDTNQQTANGCTTQPTEKIYSSLGSSRINRQFESLRDLIEVLDPVLADHMHLNEDNSHLYFYRWLLLDFKREFKYADVFLVWETIWTSYRLVCQDFEVFIAFALIQYYRDIIIFYCFDYTDIIRFYNEIAEQHDVPRLLNFARDLIHRLQTLISSIYPKSNLRSKVLNGKR